MTEHYDDLALVGEWKMDGRIVRSYTSGAWIDLG